jgi:hypothetical protein
METHDALSPRNTRQFEELRGVDVPERRKAAILRGMTLEKKVPGLLVSATQTVLADKHPLAPLLAIRQNDADNT